MPDWVIWTLVALALAVGEIFTLSFFLAPVAIAAVLAGAVALAGGGVELQLAVFVLGSLASLLLIRPIVRRHLRMPPQIRTGTAALVGSSAVVLERVDGHGGSIRLAGEVWTARAYDETQSHEPGARVTVLEIQGATALVAD
ncbi:MAG TPA: NfeD family protein [Gaiellaceae bacterium]|nr:NfeD family protein [Gaiellaceae bacterium]